MHVENDERKRLYGDSYVQMVYLNLILLFWLYLINHPLLSLPFSNLNMPFFVVVVVYDHSCVYICLVVGIFRYFLERMSWF